MSPSHDKEIARRIDALKAEHTLESTRRLAKICQDLEEWEDLLAARKTLLELAENPEQAGQEAWLLGELCETKLADREAAITWYRRANQLDPTNAESLIALERVFSGEGRWLELVELLDHQRTLAAKEVAEALSLRIARIFEEKLRDGEHAIVEYLRVLESAPQNPAALDALARIYESLGRWNELLEVTRRQIRTTQDRAQKALLYFKCGSVMESRHGRESDAIRYYDAAIKTSPVCIPAIHGLRDIYVRRRDWTRVVENLELEVRLWPEDRERAGIYAQIGAIYGERLQDGDRARSYYERACAVDPDCVLANRALFALYVSARDWSRAAPFAEVLARKAMRDGDPASRSEFYAQRGLVLAHVGEPRLAAESFVIALEIRPENQRALEELGVLANDHPDCYDFTATYRELAKLYRREGAALAPFLARTLLAQAKTAERTGDVVTAEKLGREAVELAPCEFFVLRPFVELNARLRRFAAIHDAIRGFLTATENSGSIKDRVDALLCLAENKSDGEMDARGAVSALDEALSLDKDNHTVLYRLSQELFSLGELALAKRHAERLVVLTTEQGTSTELLAQYTFYLGRILDEMGESQAANSAYRCAREHDPSFSPPSLALALQPGRMEQTAAEDLLVSTARAAMNRGGQELAIPFQRGLARLFMRRDDRAAAIQAYRGILSLEPASVDDRLGLAALQAEENVNQAISATQGALEEDPRNALASFLLAKLYERAGEPLRAQRVRLTSSLLGYEKADKPDITLPPRRGPLSDELRDRFLLPPAANSILGQAYRLIAEPLARLHAPSQPDRRFVSHTKISDPSFRIAVGEISRLMGTQADVLVGDGIGLMTLDFPRKAVLIDRELLDRPIGEQRFFLGHAFEALRGAYAPLLQLPTSARLVRLILDLLSDHSPEARAFMGTLPKNVVKSLEKLANLQEAPDVDAWIGSLRAAQDRAGLIACDDLGAAVRAIARLSSTEGLIANGSVVLEAVPGARALVKYYLSDSYHFLIASLST